MIQKIDLKQIFSQLKQKQSALYKKKKSVLKIGRQFQVPKVSLKKKKACDNSQIEKAADKTLQYNNCERSVSKNSQLTKQTTMNSRMT